MTAVWTAIAAMTVITVLIKVVGPLALGGRALPGWANRLVALLPAALLSALVITQTFAEEDRLVLDARAAGLAAAVAALVLRANMLLTLLAAAGTTALVRALG